MIWRSSIGILYYYCVMWYYGRDGCDVMMMCVVMCCVMYYVYYSIILLNIIWYCDDDTIEPLCYIQCVSSKCSYYEYSFTLFHMMTWPHWWEKMKRSTLNEFIVMIWEVANDKESNVWYWVVLTIIILLRIILLQYWQINVCIVYYVY
jgi:hypothetical protein